MSRDARAEALILEARSLEQRGLTAEAIATYETLLTRSPALPNCWYNLGRLQRKARRFNQALVSYERALEHAASHPEEVHLNRGVIYADDLRQYEAAERELNAALGLNPAYIPALFNLANLHEDLGRRDEAERTYDRILELDPNALEALARYANLHKFEHAADPLVGRLRTALSATGTASADRASLGFALGRALDACGDYPAAFEAYTQANLHSRDSAPTRLPRYDRLAEGRYINRLITAFPVARAHDPLRHNTAPSSGASLKASGYLGARRPRPIFICGMFRSGSTLTEQLLGGHPEVTAGGELNTLPHIAQQLLAPFPEALARLSAQQLQAVADLYLDSLARMFPGARLVTDKRPDNFIYIGLIKRLFPDAKIVHTLRSPLDNCLSIFFLHLDQRMSYALDLMDIGHHYRQYLRLMAHWKSCFPQDIFDVSYDTLVHQPQDTMQQLLRFLGLEWDERCLQVPAMGRVIKTASVWQAREPLYTNSSGRARHYARELDALRDYLADDLRSD